MTEIELSRKDKKKIAEEVYVINKCYGVYDVDDLIKESLERIEKIIKKSDEK